MKIKKAFTLIEMIFSIAMMSFFIFAIAFTVNKKEQQKLSAPTGGRLICYKDNNNQLNQKTEIFYRSTTRVDEQRNVDSCRFELPDGINLFNVYLIGGGGGASSGAQPIGIEEHCDSNSCPINLYNAVRTNTAVERTKFLPEVGTENVNVDALRLTTVNALSDFLDDITFQSIFLSNIRTHLKGGNAYDGTSGAICSAVNDYNVGDVILLNDGEDEQSGRFSSTAGELKINGNLAMTAQGAVVDVAQYDNLTSGVSTSPRCNGGDAFVGAFVNRGINTNDVRYDLDYLTSISIVPGNAGSPGGYSPSENLARANVAGADGRTVVINRADIGNAGIAGINNNAGGDGGTTRFRAVPVAIGGIGGAAPLGRACRPFENDSIITENQIEDRVHPNSTCVSGPYSYANESQRTGLVSNYIRDKVFPIISNAQQLTYYGTPGDCTVSGENISCQDAAPAAEQMSFGAAGSAGASAVRYDHIVQFSATYPDGTVISTPQHLPEFYQSRGSNGNGGAVIISW